jgi:hypothetical protein
MANNPNEIECGPQLGPNAIQPEPAGSVFQSLFEQHVMFASDKQVDLQRATGAGTYKIDLDLGQICFEHNLVYSVQLLGAYVYANQTWHWSWDNTEALAPPNVCQQAHRLKDYGLTNSVEIFTQSNCSIETDKLHEIGLIASGLFANSAYYVTDDGQHAMLFTLQGPDFVKTTGEQLDTQIRKTVVQTILAFEFNHAKAVEHYFKAHGFSVVRNGNQLIGTNGNSAHIAEFDELDRLLSLGGSNANPSQKAES